VCEGEDECLFPGEIVCSGCGFAVSLLVVVGEAAVDWVGAVELSELGFP